ncbi:MAG: TonB-dependent receptor plug domain-containing protein [Planctomycetota bacterium]
MFFTAFVPPSAADRDAVDDRDLTAEELRYLESASLEDLGSLPIYSASKKEESWFESAAAVFVITEEDIRRSAATSLPDLLRMVPGLQVARLNGNRWVVAARGFASVFAAKLLVLIDGRSVYTPLFAGVYWEVQDTVLEDIERIEVIRGPGAALWGANAVNGVINIITKSAKDTQGIYARGGGGNVEQGFVTARYGGEIGENASYRGYFKYLNRDNFKRRFGLDPNDEAEVFRGGWRVDWDVSERDLITFQGDVYAGDLGFTYDVADPTAPPMVRTIRADRADVGGGNVLTRWSHAFSERADLALQFYFDRTERDEFLFDEDRNTWDVDFQHRFPSLFDGEVIWGLGYRHTSDDTEPGPNLAFRPANRSEDLFSGFLQTQIPFLEDTVRLTLGTKVEHNDHTGWEVQPNGRLAWLPNERHTLWGAVSRAVREPTRSNDDFELLVEILPPNPPGVLEETRILFLGDDGAKAEDLLAFELGYRFRPLERLSVDVAAYYNRYWDLLTDEPAGFIPAAVSGLPFNQFVSRFSNQMDGETYGFELAAHWHPTDWWHLRAGYAFITMELDPDKSSESEFAEEQEDDSPTHQVQLLSYMDLPCDLQLDAAFYYVDNVKGQDVPSYTRFDFKLGWEPPREDLELFVVLQNAFDDQHAEWNTDQAIVATRIPRSVFAGVTFRHR